MRHTSQKVETGQDALQLAVVIDDKHTVDFFAEHRPGHRPQVRFGPGSEQAIDHNRLQGELVWLATQQVSIAHQPYQAILRMHREMRYLVLLHELQSSLRTPVALSCENRRTHQLSRRHNRLRVGLGHPQRAESRVDRNLFIRCRALRCEPADHAAKTLSLERFTGAFGQDLGNGILNSLRAIDQGAQRHSGGLTKQR